MPLELLVLEPVKLDELLDEELVDDELLEEEPEDELELEPTCGPPPPLELLPPQAASISAKNAAAPARITLTREFCCNRIFITSIPAEVGSFL